MKKILAILGSLLITTPTSAAVVSCKKVPAQFKNFKQVVETTKGRYSSQGEILGKSAASVLYFGAEDNASSQSFEYALSRSFGSLQQAERDLSMTAPLKTTPEYSLKNITINQNSFSVKSDLVPEILKFLVSSESGHFVFARIRIGNDKFNFHDATMELSNSNQINFTFFAETVGNETTDLQITGFELLNVASGNKPTTKSPFSEKGLFDQWTTALAGTWLQEKNSDRGVYDVNLNWDKNSRDYGRVKEQYPAIPAYGIGGGIQGVWSNGYTYAQPQLLFKAFKTAHVSDYWNNDFFKQILNDYVEPDLIYQMAANAASGIKDSTDAAEKRKEEVENLLTTVKETKGPFFFVIKNGHLIKIQKGWNVYQGLGNIGEIKGVPDERAPEDLQAWINSLSQIFANPFEFNKFDFVTQSYALTEWDEGAANWDPENWTWK